MELRDRRVLVTGASRGLGESPARAFAAAGARMALVARSEGAIRELAESLGGAAHRPIPPTKAAPIHCTAGRRADRSGLPVGTAQVPRERAVDAAVAAVRSGRRHVRFPGRAVPLPLLTEAPRRLVEVLLTGVPHR